MGIIIAITVNFQAPYASNLEDVKKSYSEYSIGDFNDSLRHSQSYSQRLLCICIYWRGIRKLCICIRNTFVFSILFKGKLYRMLYIPLGINKFFVSKKDRIMWTSNCKLLYRYFLKFNRSIKIGREGRKRKIMELQICNETSIFWVRFIINECSQWTFTMCNVILSQPLNYT